MIQLSTQSVVAVLGNGSESYTFAATATDGTYTVLTSDNGSSMLGVLIPNTTINFVMAQYAGGVGIWRIRDSVSNVIIAQNWMTASGYSWMPESRLKPIQIRPNYVLECWTQPADSTSNESNVLCLVTTNRGTSELFQGLNVADSTYTNITSAVQGQSLGSSLFGTTIAKMEVQVQDAGSLSAIKVVGNQGQDQWIAFGSQRGVTSGALDLQVNGRFTGLNIPVGKAFNLQLKTVDN